MINHYYCNYILYKLAVRYDPLKEQKEEKEKKQRKLKQIEEARKKSELSIN